MEYSQFSTIPLSRFPESSWPHIVGLMGCDYIAQVPGVGPLTLFNKILVPCLNKSTKSDGPYTSDGLIEKLRVRLKGVSNNIPVDFDGRY